MGLCNPAAVHHIIKLAQIFRLVFHRTDWWNAVGKQCVFMVGYLIVDHAAVINQQIPSMDFIDGFFNPNICTSRANQQDFHMVLMGVEDTGMCLV